MKSVIVDANKLLAAFITKGIVYELLFSGKFKLVGPERLLEEAKKHKGYIVARSGMDTEDVELALELLEPEFKIFKRSEYSDKLDDGLRIAPHLKDVEYFALALKFNFPIWSNEKAFKRQSRIKIFDTKELSELFKTKP